MLWGHQIRKSGNVIVDLAWGGCTRVVLDGNCKGWHEGGEKRPIGL